MSPLLFGRGGFLLGLALGAGAIAIAPRLARVARPVAKDAAQAGKAGYDVARDAVVKAGEEVKELISETAAGIKSAAARVSDKRADSPVEKAEQAVAAAAADIETVAEKVVQDTKKPASRARRAPARASTARAPATRKTPARGKTSTAPAAVKETAAPATPRDTATATDDDTKPVRRRASTRKRAAAKSASTSAPEKTATTENPTEG